MVLVAKRIIWSKVERKKFKREGFTLKELNKMGKKLVDMVNKELRKKQRLRRVV